MRRLTLVSFHRWVGLVFGVLLLIQGISGTAMVFRDELQRALHYDALTVVPAAKVLPMQSLVDLVRKTHPESNIVRIDYPKQPSDAAFFRLQAQNGAEQRFMSVDPYRAVITRDGSLSAWPVQWMFELHEALLTGDVGEIIVGIVGISLLLLAATAPFVWWPGRRNLRRSFAVAFNAGSYRLFRDWHRVGGIFVVLILFTIALTGITVVWKREAEQLLAHVTPIQTRPAPKVAARSDRVLLPVDRFVNDAQSQFGPALVKSVRFPGGSGRVVVVYLRARDTSRPRATDQFWFDGYTGRAIGAYQAAQLPTANRALDWMLPIHTGQAFGWIGRTLFFIAALMLSTLAVTGFFQWTGRRKLLRSKQRGAARNTNDRIRDVANNATR